MTLTPGSRLGPYEIIVPIGSGGMGEIYKARDTRLDRVVAVKVISPLFAGAPELRDRFEREARAVSQLNHPNICTLHDVGHEQGTDYLVLEFLDGESLADRLQKGPLPLEQATAIAIQICDGLDRAHRAGIVHRDLKPGNVFLVRGATASAPPTAKLLDFGLAKSSAAASTSVGGLNLTSPPTATTPLTAKGTILGTFQYMAPEQLEGAEADARTDIWAFGCVLYELLTGKKAFAGRTHASLISSIMSAQPAPVLEAVPEAPPILDQVIRTCLAKDPAERFQTAHDLLLQLRWIAGGSGVVAGAPVLRPAPRRGNRLMLAGALTGIAAVTAGATWLLVRPGPPAPVQVVRALIDLPPKLTIGTFGSRNIALTPDGTRVVYVGSDDTSSHLYVRDLSRFDPGAQLAGTTDALMPFLSPDGTWVGLFSGGSLKKMPITGGAATTISVGSPFGAVWGRDDTIVFADTAKGVLARVAAAGGTPTPVTQLEAGETAHRWPALLPDGSILFTANLGTNWSESRIVVQPAGGGARKTIIEAGTSAQYLASGHIAFVRNAALFVVPFDSGKLEVTGQPRQIADSLAFIESDGRVQLAVSSSGTLAYAVSPPSSIARTLLWVDRDGRTQPVGLETRAYEHPRISPDGRSLAVTIREANPDVWVADLGRRTLSRFTFDSAEDESAVWTPDGKRLTFAATRSGKPRGTYWKAADNSGVEEQLFTTKTHQHLSCWSPDGKTLISEELDMTFGIYRGTLGKLTAEPLLQTPFQEIAAQLSPDGKWIVYSSNESGPSQIFAQAFPGGGSRVQISTEGGSEPRWARSGREIFYRHGDQMMAVPIDFTPTLRPGAPRLLFEGQFTRIGWGQANYDVAADGRFLMIKGQEQVAPTVVRLVVNWFEELRRQ